jgi:ABC-type transport system substrate-binding protein
MVMRCWTERILDKWRTIAVIAVLALASSAAAIDLLVVESEEPNAFNPLEGFDEIANRVTWLYSRSLFRYVASEGMRELYEPVMAVSTEQTDTKNITVTIRPDAYFHFRVEVDGLLKLDSAKVTAQDVVSTYRILKGTDVSLRTQSRVDRLIRWVEDIKEVSPDKVRVTFKNQIPSPPEQVLTFQIIPAKALVAARGRGASEVSQQFRDLPYGCGPYFFDRPVTAGYSGRSWILKRTDRDDSKFDVRLSITANIAEYENQLQFYSLGPAVFPQLPPGTLTKLHKSLISRQLYRSAIDVVAFNCEHDFVREPLVRVALSQFLDRKTMAHTFSDEVDIVSGPIPARNRLYCDTCDQTVITFDTLLGNSSLTMTGYRRDASTGNLWMKGTRKVSLVLVYRAGSQGSWDAQLAKSVENAWKAMGIEVTIQGLNPETYEQRIVKGDFDAAIYRITYTDYPEIERYFLSSGTSNIMRFREPEIDKLYQSLYSSSNVNALATWYALHYKIGRLAPCAFLWTPQIWAAFSVSIDIRQNTCPQNFICSLEKWSPQ